MYEAENFEHLLGTEGFGGQMLKNHFTLYQGYVANTNKLMDALNAMAKEGKTATPEYAELKRRFGWEFNGMRLHELYFGNMICNGGLRGLKTAVSSQPVAKLLENAKKPMAPSAIGGMATTGIFQMKKGETNPDAGSELAKKITADFGSYENWEMDFRVTGAMRGIGWAILYYDLAGKKLFNVWINEHDVGHLSGCAPILVMDVFEHAYMLDYGLKRANYISAFFKTVDWAVAAGRFEG